MEVPPVRRFPACVRRDGFIELAVPVTFPERPAGAGAYLGPVLDTGYELVGAIPQELYLRELRDLDLSSPEAIARFCGDYGSLGGHDWTDMVPMEWAADDGVAFDEDEDYRRYAKWNFPELKRIAIRTEEFAGWDEGLDRFFHPDEFRVRAALLLDVADLLLALSEAQPFEDVVKNWRSTWAGTPASLDEGLSRYLIPVLNHGMRPFSPRITLQPEGVTPKPLQPTTLYSAICLQMANDLKSEVTYHVCANEPCGRLFLHQRGESETKKDSGVYYCSVSCGKAQNQRRYRRNKASRESSTNQRNQL